jgi:hypothetical protein
MFEESSYDVLGVLRVKGLFLKVINKRLSLRTKIGIMSGSVMPDGMER